MNITIIDPQTRHAITRCAGPNLYGECPQASPDGRPLCAGKIAVSVERTGVVREWTISEDAEDCFAQSLELP